MHAARDIAGQRFGRLIVLERAESRPQTARNGWRWRCRCECGTEVVILGCALRSGDTRSCGCLRRVRLRSTTRVTDLDRVIAAAIHATGIATLDGLVRMTAFRLGGVHAVLQRLLGSGLVERRGRGVRCSPYRYWLTDAGLALICEPREAA